MEEIAKTGFYTLLVDTTKNRIYLSMIGCWNNSPDFSEYARNICQATHYVSRGFTIVNDLTHFHLMSAAWKARFVEIQQSLMQQGLSRVAEILPDNEVLEMQMNAISRDSGMGKRIFDTLPEAEAWLDNLNQSTNTRSSHRESEEMPRMRGTKKEEEKIYEGYSSF
jgi:hypothetical protein